jgi:two-component system, response regulator
MQADAELLLVDDNGSDVKLTLHAMQQFGTCTKVAVVRDGEEALEFLFGRGRYALSHRPRSLRLILLDLKLPKINGFEVLRAIKVDEITKSIPVVVLTSSKQERDLVESYELGANSYVQKPVDFDVFATVVRTIRDYWFSVNLMPNQGLPVGIDGPSPGETQ